MTLGAFVQNVPITLLINENFFVCGLYRESYSKYQSTQNFGFWVATITVDNNHLRSPTLYELHQSTNGHCIYKRSTMPLQMAGKEQFIRDIQARFSNISQLEPMLIRRIQILSSDQFNHLKANFNCPKKLHPSL